MILDADFRVAVADDAAALGDIYRLLTKNENNVKTRYEFSISDAMSTYNYCQVDATSSDWNVDCRWTCLCHVDIRVVIAYFAARLMLQLHGPLPPIV